MPLWVNKVALCKLQLCAIVGKGRPVKKGKDGLTGLSSLVLSESRTLKSRETS